MDNLSLRFDRGLAKSPYERNALNQTDLALAPAMALDDSHFLILQERFAITLPKALELFYRSFNGLPIEPFTVQTENRSYSVEQILPLFCGNMSAERVLEMYQNNLWIARSFFPLAVSEEGNAWFVDCESGHIWYADPDNLKKKTLITPDLAEFLKYVKVQPA